MGILQRTETIRGVVTAVPILSRFVILDLHEKKQPVYVIGYDPKLGGRPWNLIAGRELLKKREIIFDHVFGYEDDCPMAGRMQS